MSLSVLIILSSPVNNTSTPPLRVPRENNASMKSQRVDAVRYQELSSTPKIHKAIQMRKRLIFLQNVNLLCQLAACG